MKNLENESNEKKAKRKFDVLCKITAILIIACGFSAIGSVIWAIFTKNIPFVMVVIIAILYIACVVFNTLQISAKDKYIKEIYKSNDS